MDTEFMRRHINICFETIYHAIEEHESNNYSLERIRSKVKLFESDLEQILDHLTKEPKP